LACPFGKFCLALFARRPYKVREGKQLHLEVSMLLMIFTNGTKRALCVTCQPFEADSARALVESWGYSIVGMKRG
jgi:hypothetical protein